MNPHIKEQDRIVAQSFWSRGDSTDILTRFKDDIDAELRDDLTKLGVYLHLRDNGVKHTWAALTACRRGPMMTSSDRAFNQFYRQKMERMTESFQSEIFQRARAAGVNTQGKYYVSGLGPYEDAGAWVSTTEDVLDICRDRNYSASGGVTCEARVEEPELIPLADDLVEECIQEELQADPALAEKYRKNPQRQRPAMREMVIAKYGQPRETNPLAR